MRYHIVGCESLSLLLGLETFDGAALISWANVLVDEKPIKLVKVLIK